MEIGINTQFPYVILFWFLFFQQISQINYEDNNDKILKQKDKNFII